MEPRIPKYVPVVNMVLKFLTRRGIKAGPVSVLTVAGRRSGRPRCAGGASCCYQHSGIIAGSLSGKTRLKSPQSSAAYPLLAVISMKE